MTFKISAASDQTSSQIDLMNRILSKSSRDYEMLFLYSVQNVDDSGTYELCYTPVCGLSDITTYYLPNTVGGEGGKPTGLLINMANPALVPFSVKGEYRTISGVGRTFTQRKPSMTVSSRASRFRIFSNSAEINEMLKDSTFDLAGFAQSVGLANAYDHLINVSTLESYATDSSKAVSELDSDFAFQFLSGKKSLSELGQISISDASEMGKYINWSKDVSQYNITYKLSSSVDSLVPIDSITNPLDEFALYIDVNQDSSSEDTDLVSVNFPETEDPMYAHVPNYDTLQAKNQAVVCNAFDTPEEEGSSNKAFPVTKTTVELPKDAQLYVTLESDGDEVNPSDNTPVSADTARLVSELKNFTFKVRKKGTTFVSGSTTFKKIFDVGENGAVPKAEFTFGIIAGEAKADTKSSEYRVYAGLDPDQVTVGTAAFAPSDTRDEGTTKVTKEVPVDFSKVTFPEPGIYRYILTENATTLTGIVNDENPTRILDVLVQSEDAEDGSQKCTVKSYILHKTADVIALTDADLGDDKSEGYENVYQNSSLTISKTVAGNQASHDQYFKFTLKLTGGIAGAEYRVNLDNADAAPAKNSATKYENMSNPSSFTADETGAATVDFYLQHGQSVRIDGIGKGTSYDVVEENLDYDPSTELTGDTEATNNGNEIVDTSLDADTTAAFTNTRQGTIPTGVILAMAPYLALGIAAAAGMVLYVVLKKKKESSEEE